MDLDKVDGVSCHKTVFGGSTPRYSHAPLHRQRLVGWKIFLVESSGGAVDVAGGAEGQEHREPLRRARAGVVNLHPLARHTGLRHVRDGGGADGRDDANEERAEA